MDGKQSGSELNDYSKIAALTEEGSIRYDPAAKKIKFHDDVGEKTLQEEVSGPVDGSPILVGRVNDDGTIALTEDFGSGASFTVNKFETGGYDVTLIDITAVNVHVVVQKNDNQSSRGGVFNGVTAKGGDTGFETPTGFRTKSTQLVDGGAYPLNIGKVDRAFTFSVIKLN